MKHAISFLSSILLSLAFAFMSCSREKPGPISVENDISPTILNSGDYIQWQVEVTNMGGEVEIERVHCREEFISGWGQGQYVEIDLPISNSVISEHESEIVYEQTSAVWNTGPDDLQVKNTVTVYSDGGTDTDEVIYTIKTSSCKGSSMPPTERTLIDNAINN